MLAAYGPKRKNRPTKADKTKSVRKVNGDAGPGTNQRDRNRYFKNGIEVSSIFRDRDRGI
jgi:hypothetical protein